MDDMEYKALLKSLQTANDVDLMQFVSQCGLSLGYSDSELTSLICEIYRMRKWHTPEDYIDLSGNKRDNVNFSSGSLTPIEMIRGKSVTSEQKHKLRSFLKGIVSKKRKY